MASTQNQTDGDLGFQIAPMIDVVFVLLLFFMACAGMRQTEGLIKTDLPGPTSDPTKLILPVVVDIGADGTVFIGGEKVTPSTEEALASVKHWAGAKMSEREIDESPAVLRPSLDCAHGRVIDVMSAMKSVGFRKIAFAAN